MSISTMLYYCHRNAEHQFNISYQASFLVDATIMDGRPIEPRGYGCKRQYDHEIRVELEQLISPKHDECPRELLQFLSGAATCSWLPGFHNIPHLRT